MIRALSTGGIGLELVGREIGHDELAAWEGIE